MQLRFLVLLLVAFSCGPAVPVADKVEEVEYAVVEGAPMLYRSIPPRQLQGLRLQLSGDAVRLYHPTMNFDESYRAYRADTASRYPDSTYFVYQIADNDSLYGVAHFGEHSQTMVAVATPRLHYAGLGDELIGRTYRVQVEQRTYLLYFDGLTDTQQEAAPVLIFLYALEENGQLRPVDRQISWQQPRTAMVTDTTGVVGSSLFVSADSSGQPRLHLVRGNSDNTENYIGPYPGVPYHAPTAVVGMTDHWSLISRLNQGRVLAEVPRGEPEEGEIKYGYAEDFNQGSGLPSVDELSSLDMEFRADGTFAVFVLGQPAGTGRWKLSQEGSLLSLTGHVGQSFPPPFPQVLDWSRDSIHLKVPVAVQTRRPYGTSLMSYYVPQVSVTVIQ